MTTTDPGRQLRLPLPLADEIAFVWPRGLYYDGDGWLQKRRAFTSWDDDPAYERARGAGAAAQPLGTTATPLFGLGVS